MYRTANKRNPLTKNATTAENNKKNQPEIYIDTYIHIHIHK